MSSANWKLVKDNPPPENTSVLFWERGLVYLGHRDASGTWHDGARSRDNQPSEVTHWAPLPKGPKT